MLAQRAGKTASAVGLKAEGRTIAMLFDEASDGNDLSLQLRAVGLAQGCGGCDCARARSPAFRENSNWDCPDE